MRGGAALAALVVLVAVPAQGGTQVAPVPRYGAGAECVAYAESAAAEVTSEAGSARRHAEAGRAGILTFRFRPGGRALAVEAWYDSLAVWEEEGGARRAVDVSGLLGGRWHGALDSAGGWTSVAAPFVPDGVRAVMDLAPVVPGFFPPLPNAPLPRGGQATAGALVATRSADGATLSLRRTIARTDTLGGRLAARTTGDERWTVAWPVGEPLPRGWTRVLEAVTRTSPTGESAGAVVQVRRETSVRRLARPAGCRPGLSSGR